MAKDPKEEKVTKEEEQKTSPETESKQEETPSQEQPTAEEKPSEEGKAEENSVAEEALKEEAEAKKGEEKGEDAEKLRAEVREFKDKYLRLYSEFDNYRKRTAREKAEFLKSANKDLILDLLPILDDWERADKAINPEEMSGTQVKEGYDIIFQKFRKSLEKLGVKIIPVEKGDAFDVEKHEAVTQFPAPSDDLKGKVVDELEKGYQLGEKVIRFSKVVVGV